MLTHMPCTRHISIEKIDNMVEFLASDKANYVAGRTLFVDGGMTYTQHLISHFTQGKNKKMQSYRKKGTNHRYGYYSPLHYPQVGLEPLYFQASSDSLLLILLNMSTTEILTADIPVLNGNAPFPSSVIALLSLP